MKISLQNRLLFPIISAIATLMITSTLITTNIVNQKFEDSIYQGLEATTLTLISNIKTTTNAYKTYMRSIASTNRIYILADALYENSSDLQDIIKQSNITISDLNKTYHEFESISIAVNKGVLISTDEESKGLDISNYKFFKDAMNGDTTLSEPIHSPASNTNVVVVSTPLRTSKNNIVGVIYARIPCADIVKQTIEGVRIGRTGYPYILDKNGLMLAHIDQKRIRVFDAKKTALAKTLTTPKGIMPYTTSTGVDRIVSFQREEESGWVIITSVDIEEIDQDTATIRNISIGIMLVGLVLIAFIIFFIVRPIIRALLSGVDYAKAIADGNLDKPFTIRRTDELGELFSALAVMVHKLKDMIATSQQKERQALDESEKAQQAMTQAEVAKQDAQTKTTTLLKAADELEHVGDAVSSASTRLSEQIGQSEQISLEAAKNLSEAATAMNQMNATVHEVAQNASSASEVSLQTRQKAESGSDIVERVLKRINEAQGASLQVKHDMADLNEQTASISQIMGVISDIADQTNLLALNAAIEAARAGEAGRGFAVVADEVRKLAEKTMMSTQDVGKAVSAMQTSAAKSTSSVEKSVLLIEEATELANESGQALVEIVQMVEASADQIKAIATASEEQSAASEQVNRSINQVSEMSNQTAIAMKDSAFAIEELATQTETLAKLIRNLKQS